MGHHHQLEYNWEYAGGLVPLIRWWWRSCGWGQGRCGMPQDGFGMGWCI